MPALSSQIEYEPLDRLQLDPINPRLTEGEQAAVTDQLALLKLMDRQYDPLTIAESIAEHGYFASEPMIVLDEGGDKLTVLEGNRRLTALKGLADPEVSKHFKDPERWDALRDAATLPSEVPVLRAETRAGVAPLIGYRHISGIEPWRPLQKARFVAQMVDEGDKLSFDDVREQVGEPRSTVAALYRNRAVLRQGREWGIDTEGAERAFGVFTAALNRRALREFARIPPAPQVNERTPPLDPNDTEARANLSELLGWIFGERRVLKDSRELRDLALVVDSKRALDVLRETRDLAKAYAAAGGPQQQVTKRLRAAASGLEDSVRELGENSQLAEDESVAHAARECVRFAGVLDELIPDSLEQ